MYYIDRKGYKLENEDKFSEYVDKGACGEIYRYGDTILKKYYLSTEHFIRIKKDIFDFLKDTDYSCFIKLYNAYMKIDYDIKSKLWFRITNHNKFIIDAYTAKYYEKTDIDPAFISKEYLLESFYKIESFFNYLSKNKIKVYDIKRENVVFTDDGIVLVDPDLYEFLHEYSVERTLINNKICLNYLFKSILINNCNTTYECDKLDRFYVDNFNPNSVTSKTEVTSNISKVLKNVKKPIEIIRR